MPALDEIRKAVLDYINASERPVPTWMLQYNVGESLGVNMSHDRYGPPENVLKLERAISRIATNLARDGQIVRTVQMTGRGLEKSAYYKSIAVHEAEQLAARQAEEAERADLDRRKQISDRFALTGYNITLRSSGDVVIDRADAERLLRDLEEKR